jgi:hypothetical protein
MKRVCLTTKYIQLLDQLQSKKIPMAMGFFLGVYLETVISDCSENVNTTGFHHGSVFSGFRARIKTPLVLGELFKPVSDTSCASTKPIL